MLAYFSHNDPNDDDSEEEDEESDESVEDEERNEDSVSDGTKEATKVLFKIPREKVEHAGPRERCAGDRRDCGPKLCWCPTVFWE